jgi:alpha-tubulin suppressor-like RCC1 family protein
MGSSSSVAPGTKVDVYFLSDSTGSMGEQLDSTKKNSSSILEKIRTTGADVRFGVGNYKDFDGSSKAFEPQESVTDDLGAITAAINDWQAGGGGKNDLPEAQLYALDQLATGGNAIGWRPDAQRIVIWFGDAPGHDPICQAISGLSYDITEQSVIEKLKRERIRVVALSTPSGLDHDPRESAPGYVSQCGKPGGRPGQATRIATATGGSHTSGVSADTIADTIVERVHTQINNAPLRGPVLSWGQSAYGELGVGEGQHNSQLAIKTAGDLTDITHIAAGWNSTAVVLADGTVRSWGRNDWWQLGDATHTGQPAPVEALDVTGARRVAIGWHTLITRDDGVWSWGADNFGQIGDGPHPGDVAATRRKTLPIGHAGLIAVAVGEHHSLALDDNGSVWAWGDNSYGQLGTGDNTGRDRPVQVHGIGQITAIAAGWNFSLALDTNTRVWAWGHNGWKQLGNGTDDTSNHGIPKKVRNLDNIDDLTGVTAIAAGLGHSLAVLHDRTVCVWGSTWEGQGGTGKSGLFYHTPVKVLSDTTKNAELADVTTVAAGHYHSLALHTDGTVSAWGWNVEGQLGDGTATQRLTAVKVKDGAGVDLTGVKAIAAGQRHSVAVCG